MSVAATHSPVTGAASSPRVLRKLFLTLFLRGRSSRGLRKDGAPRSVARLLWVTLLFYGIFGLFALSLLGQPLQVLSTYLHSATFLFVAMFVAASGGEILFNKEEADILLHRPITPSALLQAKAAVLVEVALWLAAAFNITGLLLGTFGPTGNWRFPVVHVASITLEALFCTSCVVLAYQLCLRWLGRERLESLMTTVQVLVAIAMVLSAQLLPRMVARLEQDASLSPWTFLLPPAWFAALDDAVAGSGAARSWLMGAAAVLITAGSVWLASRRLARHYLTGLQLLIVTSSAKPSRGVLRWSKLAQLPPLRWWLRTSAQRTAFVLVLAYMLRNRETKLRLYPNIAPSLAIPLLLVWQPGSASGNAFMVTFVGAFIGMIPMVAVSLLRYCEHWQAADLFRMVPLVSPAQLSSGARVAVLTLMLPLMLAVLGLMALALPGRGSLTLLLPGAVLLPVYVMIPSLRGLGIPVAEPAEQAQSANRGLWMMAVMAGSFVISGLALWAYRSGHFWEFMLTEAALTTILYCWMRRSLARASWPPME